MKTWLDHYASSSRLTVEQREKLLKSPEDDFSVISLYLRLNLIKLNLIDVANILLFKDKYERESTLRECKLFCSSYINERIYYKLEDLI